MITLTETSVLTIRPERLCKHPTLNIIVRDDGCVLPLHLQSKFLYRTQWSFGSQNPRGYRTIAFRTKAFQVHRLVAETYIPNPENKPTVDHINRVRDDNRAANLRWATQAEQTENSSKVLDRLPFSVREFEDRKQYQKEYNKYYWKSLTPEQREQQRIYHREYYRKNKDKLNAVRRPRRRKKHV